MNEEDLSRYPLALTGDTVPMVRFMNVTKAYGPPGRPQFARPRRRRRRDGVDHRTVRIGQDDRPAHADDARDHQRRGDLCRRQAAHPHGAKRQAGAIQRHLRRMRTNIGMCFQHFNLFPHMTALENCMEAPVHVLGLPRQEARERAVELLGLVGLADKVDQHPLRLSGGQQRVTIARALAMRPKVMLFDEVTSALDPVVIGEVTSVIRKLVAEHNLTMLMVTHQMGFAKEISDRVCFFFGGKIEEQGAPQALFGSPEKERTRQFLSAVLETT